MADLDGLIRYRKHIVDEKQKLLAELFRQAEAIEQRKQAIIDQMTMERAAAHESNDMHTLTALGLYMQGVQSKVKKFDKELAFLDDRIQTAQDSVRESFGEQKKAEIVQRKRQAREVIALNEKDAQELDAIAIEAHRRTAQDLEEH